MGKARVVQISPENSNAYEVEILKKRTKTDPEQEKLSEEVTNLTNDIADLEDIVDAAVAEAQTADEVVNLAIAGGNQAVIQQAVIDAQKAHATAQKAIDELNRAKAARLSKSKAGDRLDYSAQTVELPLASAEDFEADEIVATIENVNDSPTFITPRLITEEATTNYAGEYDGQLMDGKEGELVCPNSCAYNLILDPFRKMRQPLHRTGIIVAINTDADPITCSVALDYEQLLNKITKVSEDANKYIGSMTKKSTYFSGGESGPVQPPIDNPYIIEGEEGVIVVSDIGFSYLDCNESAFELKDKVVVRWDREIVVDEAAKYGRKIETEVNVIGFNQEPIGCATYYNVLNFNSTTGGDRVNILALDELIGYGVIIQNQVFTSSNKLKTFDLLVGKFSRTKILHQIQHTINVTQSDATNWPPTVENIFIHENQLHIACEITYARSSIAASKIPILITLNKNTLEKIKLSTTGFSSRINVSSQRDTVYHGWGDGTQGGEQAYGVKLTQGFARIKNNVRGIIAINKWNFLTNTIQSYRTIAYPQTEERQAFRVLGFTASSTRFYIAFYGSNNLGDIPSSARDTILCLSASSGGIIWNRAFYRQELAKATNLWASPEGTYLIVSREGLDDTIWSGSSGSLRKTFADPIGPFITDTTCNIYIDYDGEEVSGIYDIVLGKITHIVRPRISRRLQHNRNQYQVWLYYFFTSSLTSGCFTTETLETPFSPTPGSNPPVFDSQQSFTSYQRGTTVSGGSYKSSSQTDTAVYTDTGCLF